MLRIAIQSKGRLYEESMALLEEAGIKIPGRGRCWFLHETSPWKCCF